MKLLAASILLSLFFDATCVEFRIFGGFDAPQGKYPYVASLQKPIHWHFCTGSIISHRWILTAAHCLHNLPDDSVTAVLGATNISSSSGDYYQSEYLIYHPSFNAATFQRDIGMIRLARDVEFNEEVQPIALPTENFERDEYPSVFTGWGYTSYDEYVPEVLQLIHLKVISAERCRLKVVQPRITKSHICTLNKPGEGICSGDSGGPLVADGVQIGIASFGKKGQCAEGYPDVFTRVYTFLDWIKGEQDKYEREQKSRGFRLWLAYCGPF